MRQLLLLISLCATLACQATESDTPGVATEPAVAASAVPMLPEGRCPLPRRPSKQTGLPSGDFRVAVRMLIKADGTVENIRVEGRGDRSFKRAVLSMFDGYRCLPAETDQEYVTEIGARTSRS
ncbi:MAG: hypothetical protein HY020_10475 [Burkholderiales bacterium]|nr:hypothetical protein [Burkholderiales bacterium]